MPPAERCRVVHTAALSGILPQRGRSSPVSSTAAEFRTQVENLSTTNSNIFSAYAQDGTAIDVSSGLTRAGFNPNDLTDSVNKIFTLQVQINVQGARNDIGTTSRPEVFLTATAQINN